MRTDCQARYECLRGWSGKLYGFCGRNDDPACSRSIYEQGVVIGVANVIGKGSTKKKGREIKLTLFNCKRSGIDRLRIANEK